MAQPPPPRKEEKSRTLGVASKILGIVIVLLGIAGAVYFFLLLTRDVTEWWPAPGVLCVNTSYRNIATGAATSCVAVPK